jgi:hypothetical protein
MLKEMGVKENGVKAQATQKYSLTHLKIKLQIKHL